MSDLRITINVLGRVSTNCYFISNDQTKEAIIVDPADNAPLIQEKCEEMQISPVAILLTHGHFDHIMAALDVKKAFQIPIYAGADEKAILSDPSVNCSKMIGKGIEFTADQWLKDGDILNLAGFSMEVIATPGHTAGSVCYYFAQESILISGDTLFKEGLGRTDLPTGDQSTIIKSIKRRLFSLPENTVVYPGHDSKTTIEHEKLNNIIFSL